MSNRKPVPLYERRPVPRCPVCKKPSYSRAGIHPQCAAERADMERMNRVRAARAVAEEANGDDSN